MTTKPQHPPIDRTLRSVFWVGFPRLTDAELAEEREACIVLAEGYRSAGDKLRATQALRDSMLLGGILLSRKRQAENLARACS